MIPTERHPVEALADEFVARHRRGEKPSLTEYVKRFPEWSDEIRDLLPAALMMESLKRSRVGSAAIPKRLGDFRLLREVGRGGMGVVYEAEQETLGRHVAVKVLSARGDPDTVKRFRREAKAAARLHHSNIVPVYGVGQADGILYYVMPFIRGLPLDDLVAGLETRGAGPVRESRREAAKPSQAGKGPASAGAADEPSWIRPSGSPFDPALGVVNGPAAGAAYYRAVARVGIQVAEALEYAHTQGVLHRDIKPANLILDNSGTVWVTDFGLAKLVGSDRLTRTGEAPGTVRYMPPERFEGQSDIRGDVYGLGVTLYELLALRPAFEAADPATLLREVTAGRPVSPRVANPAVPADLEAIVCKAIAREPEQRYPTVAALAAELQRFVDGRAPTVRKVSQLERGWRLCRRNPMVASLSAVLSAVLLVAFAATLGSWRGATAQRQRAEANLAVALEALDAMFARLGGDGLADLEGFTSVYETGPPISDVAASLLREALVFYERFASQNEGDARISRAAAAAHARAGDIQRRLGRHAEAAMAYRRACELYARLGDVRDAAAARLRLGGTLAMAGEHADAERELRKGLDDLERRARQHPDDVETQYENAQARYLLGKSLAKSGRAQDGEQEFRAAAEQLHRVVAAASDRPAHRLTLARCLQRLALGARLAGRSQEYARCAGEALDLLEQLVRDNPTAPLYRLELSQCLGTVGANYQEDGRRERAGPYLQRSVDLARALVVEFPDPPHYQSHLALALRRLGLYLLAAGQRQQAEKAFRECLIELETVVARNPDTPALRQQQAETNLFFAKLLRQAGELPRAVTLLERAAASQEAYVRLNAASEIAREALASLYTGIAQAQTDLGQTQAAAETQRKVEALRPPSQKSAKR